MKPLLSVKTGARRIKPRRVFQLGLRKGGRVRMCLVHQLVALTYLPNTEGRTDINHKDGNTLNNHVDNLEWTTKAENMAHATKNGLLTQYSEKQIEARRQNGHKTGALNGIKHRRKFTMGQAQQIREMRQDLPVVEIARRMDCCERTVRNIVNGITYKSNRRNGT